MVRNGKVTGRASSVPAGLAVSGIVSLVTTVLIVTIGGALISKEILPQEQIGYCSMLALLLGAVMGAVTAVRKIQRRRILVCMMSGGVYFLVLLAITAMFFGGQYQGVGVTFLLILGGSVIGALATNREGNRLTRKKYRKIHR